MINRNARQNEQEYKANRKGAYKIFKKKRVLFKSKLEQMEIAYNNNEAKKFYQNSIVYEKDSNHRLDWLEIRKVL